MCTVPMDQDLEVNQVPRRTTMPTSAGLVMQYAERHNCGKCGLHHKGHGTVGECSLPTLYIFVFLS